MRYISTRGRAPALDFAGATLAGLASDGGLYLPETWPTLAPDQLRALRGQPYAQVAFAVMRPFIGSVIDDATLQRLIDQAYARFHHSAVAPLVQIDHRHFLLELFHGPTLAFKDFALQFLGLVFEHLLAVNGRRLTIVGATSGDTGSAAIDAVAGRANIEIFMLHPEGRVSEVQRRQMTTVSAANVHNIAVAGTFDDCQAMVKDLFADADFRDEVSLSAVNSINWTRVMAQIVYYVYSGLALGAPDRSIAYAVPTGNFGDVFAGYGAARIGLPIEKLIVATNVNDIMTRALTTGDYRVAGVTATQSPSMDIQVASNFERLLFDLYGRDGAAITALMADFQRDKSIRLLPPQLQAAQALFAAHRVDEAATKATIAAIHQDTGMVIDPHSAVGIAAARAKAPEGGCPVVTLATAHPAKFPDAVEAACGVRPALPAYVGGLFEAEERYQRLPHDLARLKAYVRERQPQ